MHGYSLEKINKAIKKYSKNNENCAQLLASYQELLELQFQYLEHIDVPFNLEEEDIKEYLRQGHYLLADESLNLDLSKVRELMFKIAKVLLNNESNLSQKLELLESLPELQEENLSQLLNRKGGNNPENVESYLRDNAVHDKCNIEPEVITNIIFTALSPFYMNYAGKAAEITDFSLWSNGFCPVCGQKPMMAMLRSEDNARILECWLCHTQWKFSRLECPYCNNKDYYKMGYFFVDEEKSRRINVCEHCKSYIKTISLKEIAGNVILDVENLCTMNLDLAAQEKGYKPGQDLSLLN